VGNSLGDPPASEITLTLFDRAHILLACSGIRSTCGGCPGGVAMTVGYVGSARRTWFSAPRPSTSTRWKDVNGRAHAAVANTAGRAGLASGSATVTHTVAAAVLARQSNMFSDQNKAAYDSMIVKAQKRFSKG
jgi:hypothetical protein